MIHQYKNNGYNIVMDIASGSVHVVDDVVYDAVALLEPVIGEVMSPVQIPETARMQRLSFPRHTQLKMQKRPWTRFRS